MSAARSLGALLAILTALRHAAVQKPDSSSLLGFIRNLWHLIDQIHNAIQRFQQRLVSLTTPISGANDDPHGTDHAILLAVWADDMLVNLVGLVHLYLMRDRNGGQYGPEREGDEELERTRAESSMRVFKCLKLLACVSYCRAFPRFRADETLRTASTARFASFDPLLAFPRMLTALSLRSQLYCNSEDRHNVIHLLMHLVPLSNWTSLVAMRIGQPGGPLNEEFEITEEELDWCVRHAQPQSMPVLTGRATQVPHGSRAQPVLQPSAFFDTSRSQQRPSVVHTARRSASCPASASLRP